MRTANAGQARTLRRLLARIHLERLVAPQLDLPGRRAGPLPDVTRPTQMHGDLAPRIPRLRMIRSKLGSALEHMTRDRVTLQRSHDDVAARVARGVKPPIVGLRDPEREQIVVRGRLADQDLAAVHLLHGPVGRPPLVSFLPHLYPNSTGRLTRPGSPPDPAWMPDNLIEGLRRFRSEVFPQYREHYRNLVDAGQKPATLFIGCADSRVMPEVFTGAGPGE